MEPYSLDFRRIFICVRTIIGMKSLIPTIIAMSTKRKVIEDNADAIEVKYVSSKKRVRFDGILINETYGSDDYNRKNVEQRELSDRRIHFLRNLRANAILHQSNLMTIQNSSSISQDDFNINTSRNTPTSTPWADSFLGIGMIDIFQTSDINILL